MPKASDQVNGATAKQFLSMETGHLTKGETFDRETFRTHVNKIRTDLRLNGQRREAAQTVWENMIRMTAARDTIPRAVFVKYSDKLAQLMKTRYDEERIVWVWHSNRYAGYLAEAKKLKAWSETFFTPSTSQLIVPRAPDTANEDSARAPGGRKISAPQKLRPTGPEQMPVQVLDYRLKDVVPNPDGTQTVIEEQIIKIDPDACSLDDLLDCLV